MSRGTRIGSGAIWFPQARRLEFYLLLFVLLLGCGGERGVGCSPTSIRTVCSLNGTLEARLRWTSCPLSANCTPEMRVSRSTLNSADAARRVSTVAFGSMRTITPVPNMFPGPNDAWGVLLTHLASDSSMTAISVAAPEASVSVCKDSVSVVNRCPENRLSFPTRYDLRHLRSVNRGSCLTNSFSSSARKSASSSALFSFVAARSFACPASCVARASNWSLVLRNFAPFARSWPLIDEIFTPTPNSPMTPAITKTMLAISIPSFISDGPSGINSETRHSFTSFLWSRITTTISSATPIATSNVNHPSHGSKPLDWLSRAAISLSKADMALCRAEAALGRVESVQIKCAVISASAILCLLGATPRWISNGTTTQKLMNAATHATQ
jgi:hypothetical protein